MSEVGHVFANVFEEPWLPAGKTEKITDEWKKRYQLLDYDDVMKLSDVMETRVPIDGKGNFPSLEVTPSDLVQMVRSCLTKEGIRVPSVRLNGSAATHVLSDSGKHPYKDLDLIFSVDLSEYNDHCDQDYNQNCNNSNSHCKGYKNSGRKTTAVDTNGFLKPPQSGGCYQELQVHSDDDEYSKGTDGTKSAILVKNHAGDEEEFDLEDKESGYTSSGSSVSSLPMSPSGSWVYQNPMRSRTHSLDSSSSAASSCSVQYSAGQKDGRCGQKKPAQEHQECCVRSKDACWQKIKSVVMTILRELLPADVKGSRMSDAIITDAYVQKMVKISNGVDRWSLISLNNDAGRNLELKFVEKMRRQYEFSVDSFQIILDSYQRYKIVSRSMEKAIPLSPHFFPSVLAESVYGDIQAALRHLRHRRICTKRPEEIRGGGLLRYCNLRVRDFTPGEAPGHAPDDMPSQSDPEDSRSRAEAVKKLEQLMCSRFFIDFSEFERQQRKIQSYLNSHFRDEDDLKFQYLLIVENVVGRGNICLMSHERTKILNYIRKIAVEALSLNVSNSPKRKNADQTTVAVTQPYYAPQNMSQSYQHQHSHNPEYYPQYPVSNDSSSGYYYYAQQHYYPHCEDYYSQSPLSVALCPCCQTTYVPSGTTRASEHLMSANSPPFIPSAKSSTVASTKTRLDVIYLRENDKLIYTAGPDKIASL